MICVAREVPVSREPRERMTFYSERMEKDFLSAVDATLAAIRQASREGRF